MVINVYGNGRGGKYICRLTHANVWVDHKNGNVEGDGAYGYEHGFEYINSHRFIGVYEFCRKRGKYTCENGFDR